MPFQPGQRVGRYRVVRLLAQGGMAEVYRAEQELAAGIFRPAALKVIRPEYSGSQDFREMFLDEARTASTLSHPNIVHIYDVGEDGGLLYMAMELVPGETLANVARTLRDRNVRFTDEVLLAVGIFTCSALEAVHALKLPGEGHVNLVHRDLSPHNLLLSSSGSLKLIDFGIAKAATNRNLTSPGVTKGKAGYFSPEQAMGRALDGRSDLFSLGVTLYKLAHGATPFDDHRTHHSRNTALVRGQWESLRKVCPGLLPGLYAVAERALELRPEDRYADAREMREALERVAVDSGIHVGQSSLAGWVGDDGEISATPSQKHQVLRPPPPDETALDLTLKRKGEPAAPARRKTERVMASPATEEKLKRTRFALVGASAGALVVIAAVSWLLLRTGPAPVTSPLPPPEKVEVEAQPEAAISISEPVVESPRPAVRPPATSEPKGRPKPSKVSVAPKEPERREEPAERRIPKGEGRLRIGATPNGEVVVGKEVWGTTPVDRKIPSGLYSVFITANGRKGRCEAEVMPDKVNIYIYNFELGSCRRTQ
ncbi:MAG: protein kinase [Myxococcales bacterium]|nr:protein kinase [Myxococcales bacterium]